MQPTLCSRCKKNVAVVFISKLDGEKTVNEGLCLKCAKELGLPQVDDMMKRMGISDEDLDTLNSEMLQAMNGVENIEDLPGGDEEDAEEEGKTATFPFLNRLFSSGDVAKEEGAEENGQRDRREKKEPKSGKRKYLENYCISLTQKAKDGKLDPVIGRAEEIERVIQILNRRQKNNPCLIGEPGVGKTAIAEGLSQRIVDGEVPFKLRGKEVHLLDLTALVAGTQFRGQFESRMKGLIDEVKRLGNIILMIDEIHNIAGAGDAEGSMNAANILKPALSRGEIQVIGATTLRQVVGYLNGEAEIAPAVPADDEPFAAAATHYAEDFADVRGQTHVKRALEIAAAGGHNVIMVGAPGSGKTMLARRLPTILPPLSREEALETTKIHSVAGKAGVTGGLMTRRPFRAPHHTASQVAVIGGGQSPRPGEVSLAHNGVLFLDELPEFGRSVLEVLRQPLEEKKIVVSRARYSVEYPANFTLVAAMNPCPCGYYNHPTKECTCSPGSVHRYMGRISGPLMDRIDLHVEVTPVTPQELSAAAPGEASAAVRERVIRARAVQEARFGGVEGVHTNSMMNRAMLREHCRLDAASAALLERAMERLSLSARAYDRILKAARTIADLAGRADIVQADIAEAINYRSLDRGNWGR